MRTLKSKFIVCLLFFATLSLWGRELELRGIWMQATLLRDKRTAEEIAQRIASAKLNAVFVLVYYWGGKSFFRTDYAPLVDDKLKEEDLFNYFIDECHKRGIKVYARFSNGLEGRSSGDGILANHPEWQIVNIMGERRRWFDLGKQEVREFQLKLLNDLLSNYPHIDGVQLDYIRFPSTEYCYCEECRLNFKKSYGIDPLELYSALPTNIYVASVPFRKPVEAKVIARFENGIPAIAHKEYNSGWLLLFNWRINDSSLPLFLQVLHRVLEGGKKLFIPLAPRELAYEEEGFGEIIKALRNAGIEWKLIGNLEESGNDDAVLLLPAVRMMGERISKDLENFIHREGKIIITLGKGGIKEGRGYEKLLGMEGKGSPLNGYHMVIPLENHPLIPVFPDTATKRKELMEQWSSFRKGLVTSLVEEFYKRVKSFNSSLELSSAVFYRKNLADKVLQDWYSWLDKGIVDFVAPMAYVDDGNLASALREWKSYDPDLKRIIPGLSIYKVKNGKELPKDKSAVTRQIRLIEKGGARGFILFSLPFLTEDLARELAKLQ